MVAQLEQHWPRVLAVAVCMLLSLWLSLQGDDQRKVRDAGDRLAEGNRVEAVRLAGDVDGRPAQLRALVVQGEAWMQRGDARRAITAYSDAVRLSPNDWKLRRSLALALGSAGRADAGRRQLARAMVLNPRMATSGDLPAP
jgi:Flp pilus assembly protein TadD